MFSELERNEYLADGLSEEEIDLLEEAFADCKTIDLIPDDVKGFIEEYKRKIPEDNIEGMKAILNTAIEDPEFFKKLMALDDAISADSSTSLNLAKLDNLTQEEYNKASENYFKTLSSLSEKDRQEFIKVIINATAEQKQDIIERLKNN